ncbi:hypothetical protein FB45DRAFT_934451 [Roridomyces roridus]|uniref:Uncharacterized protein n=1 Tax=Roridomyces roridus TaxID=1738132 RepID=A0AAD7BBR1_9AGAR|nr:hypothetical protein FB45DRAFT_934451 [Roridomyces roridus]
MDAVYLLASVLFMLRMVDGLQITVPTGPLGQNATIMVGWTATADDPLSFILALVCTDTVAVQAGVDRTVSMHSGNASFVSPCVGTNYIQALGEGTTSSPPLANSSHFQIITSPSASSSLLPPSATRFSHFLFPTPFNHSESGMKSTLEDVSSQVRLLTIISAVLGTGVFLMVLAFIVPKAIPRVKKLWIRFRARNQILQPFPYDAEPGFLIDPATAHSENTPTPPPLPEKERGPKKAASGVKEAKGKQVRWVSPRSPPPGPLR